MVRFTTLVPKTLFIPPGSISKRGGTLLGQKYRMKAPAKNSPNFWRTLTAPPLTLRGFGLLPMPRDLVRKLPDIGGIPTCGDPHGLPGIMGPSNPLYLQGIWECTGTYSAIWPMSGTEFELSPWVQDLMIGVTRLIE